MTDEERTTWKHALAEATGNWAFVLSISRRMVFTLRCVRDGDHGGVFLRGESTILGRTSGQWIPAVGSLMKRGLVIHTVSDEGSRYTLSPAGECVCKLLEYAGLMDAKRDPVILPAPEVKVRKRRAA
jgi:hypothetical protein